MTNGRAKVPPGIFLDVASSGDAWGCVNLCQGESQRYSRHETELICGHIRLY